MMYFYLIGILVSLFTVTFQSLVPLHNINDVYNRQVGWVNLKLFNQSILDVTPILIQNVEKLHQCALLCIETESCESINLIKESLNESYICQVLKDSKHKLKCKFVTGITNATHGEIKVSLLINFS